MNIFDICLSVIAIAIVICGTKIFIKAQKELKEKI